ncbi:unnamed protein product [Notodromas monacha]|uniref:Uncharacterized protein n=1 Tax=Notodromas monacha TaxID=399045 RepID=A0A7R9BF49_9CRUS|nr:unnamed protein product [Notodromas monacha]CAG0912670.1 unnamed protein product [Notodromas monacha]
MDFLGAPGFPGAAGPGIAASQVTRSGVMESLIEAVLAPLGITAGREVVKVIALEVFAQLPEGHLKWAMMNAAVSGVPILNLAISGYQYFCIATMIYDTYVKLRDNGEIPGVPAATKVKRKRRGKASSNGSSPNAISGHINSMDYFKSKLQTNNLVNSALPKMPAMFQARKDDPNTLSSKPAERNVLAKPSAMPLNSWFKNMAVRWGIPLRPTMIPDEQKRSSAVSSPTKVREPITMPKINLLGISGKLPEKPLDFASFYREKMGAERYRNLVESIVRRSMQRKTRGSTPEKSVASNASVSRTSQSASRAQKESHSPVPISVLNENRVVAGTDYESMDNTWRDMLITVDLVPRHTFAGLQAHLPMLSHPVDAAIARLSYLNCESKQRILRSALKPSSLRMNRKNSSVTCSSRRSTTSTASKRKVKFHPSAKKPVPR